MPIAEDLFALMTGLQGGCTTHQTGKPEQLLCRCFRFIVARTKKKNLDAAIYAGRYIVSLQILDKYDPRYYGVIGLRIVEHPRRCL